MNRAKARLQRRAEEMEAQRREAAAEAADMPDLKAQESGQMKRKLDSLGLVEHDVCFTQHLPFTLGHHCCNTFSHADITIDQC